MKDILKTIIKDFHTRPFPDFTPRELDVPVDLGKITSIIGPRRAGKTWYFFQLMATLEKQGVNREQILYLNFEDERLDFQADYNQILEAYMELYPDIAPENIYLFFDEIQELPNWEKYIRRLYDSVTRRIFLTGSNAKMLSQELATSLRGRSLAFELMPLSFREYLLFLGIDSQDHFSTKNRARIKTAFEDYLVWGGYPELVAMDPRFRAPVLQEYFSVLLYRDLMERYQIRDASILKYLIKRLISSFTKEFSVNKLYNDLKSRGLKIGKDTLYSMIDQIFSVYMVTAVEKYDPAVVKRELANRKVYLYDNGLASISFFSRFEGRGKLLENLVFCMLRKSCDEIFFLKNGFECDFVALCGGQEPQLIQVADVLHQDNLERELKGLEKALQRVKKGKALLIVNEVSVPAHNIPNWVHVVQITDWLLSEK